MRFTYAAYAELLCKISKAGYTFADYHDHAGASRPCILRHDVDFDMEKALALARLEADAARNGVGKIKSTYFVLMNTSFYNLFARENRKRMEELYALGHEIGLHFDEAQYDDCGDWALLCEHIEDERYALSKIAGQEITTVSMHRPSPNLLAQNLEIPNAINTYSEEFLHGFKYFSDSRMHWREDVEGAVDAGSYERLHILTHAFWYENEERDARAKLNDFVASACVERYDQLNGNLRDLNEFMTRQEVLSWTQR